MATKVIDDTLDFIYELQNTIDKFSIPGNALEQWAESRGFDYWNSVNVSLQVLKKYIEAGNEMPPESVLHAHGIHAKRTDEVTNHPFTLFKEGINIFDCFKG